jgi:hypothetical protein
MKIRILAAPANLHKRVSSGQMERGSRDTNPPELFSTIVR